MTLFIILNKKSKSWLIILIYYTEVYISRQKILTIKLFEKQKTISENYF